jgi:hypothetical protein
LPREAAPETVFFVDRSLGGVIIVQALRNAGAEVIAHDDAFDQAAPDTEWLEATGRRRWIVLTKDSAIRHNPLERAAFQAANARVFALTRKDLAGAEMAAIFVNALPGMRKRIATVDPPFVFSISRSGEFKRLD